MANRSGAIGDATRRLAAGRGPALLCAALLAAMAVNFLIVLPQKAITTDEVVHIPAGYAYWARRDFRPNDEHPPLAKLWATLPLLALRPTLPPVLPADTPDRRTLNNARYFWEENRDRFVALGYWARLPMVALTLALGALIYGYARRLWGPRAAVLAVALYSLEPTILGHGRVVHTDVPAALAYLAVAVALHAYAARPGEVRRAALLGLAMGAALATKYSLLIVAPVVAVSLAILGWLAPRRGVARGRIARDAALAALVAYLVLRAAYLGTNQPLEAADRAWLAEQGTPGAAAAIDALGVVIPRYYLIGAYTVLRHNAEGHPAGLLGMQSDHGWWYYFPVAFALKTALPFLLLTVGALAWAAWGLARGSPLGREARLVALLAPGALYTASTMASQINIGIRHLLPAFPFLFILGGAALDRLLCVADAARAGRPRRPTAPARLARTVTAVALVALTLGWMAVGAARAYPDYLSAMNELTRGQPGWRFLSDSNVEWDDDVPALARYLRERGETSVRAALVGGRETLQYYGVAYRDLLLEPDAATGYIAVGASFLNGSTAPDLPGRPRDEVFAEYRSRAPVAVFGRSIYLYAARPAPPALAAPLPADAFRAVVAVERPPTRLRPGETATLTVRLTNAGPAPWPAARPGVAPYQLRLGDRWFDARGATLVRDDARAPLPYPLYPGETTTLRLAIAAPAAPGDYLLDLDLVQEGVAWFADRGSAPLRLPVRVAAR